MSATLPNSSELAKWLEAELYNTDFRPIPLSEQAVVCGEIYNKDFKLLRKLLPLPEIACDIDYILQLCLETIKDSCSVLIFCPTKKWCETLAQQIASAFFKLGSTQNKWGILLRDQLNTNLIMELLEQLKCCPTGLDKTLCKSISFGVGYHHAGLTMDEREIIEVAFRNGSLRILVATTTLSSGVNLPARRVIIRTPIFHRKPLDILSYRQMMGRAGRMGKDSLGESFLICQKNEIEVVKELMSAELTPIESCLDGIGKLKRAVLEIIASGVASSLADINLFTECTLLAINENENLKEDLSNSLRDALSFLTENEFIKLQKLEDHSEKYFTTSLGKACLTSSMAPDEALALFTELAKARECFVLETELHLIYLVTPYSACHSWGNIDWIFYLNLWEQLPSTMKRVAELIGVKESYIVNATRRKISTNTNRLYHEFLIHKRFFVALALQDLVNEKSLEWVCSKFNCNRGMLQSLQQSASSFAGMMTSFSRQLGWSSVELLVSQFQDRLQFGVSRDLLDLMRLPILNGKIARALFNSNIQTIAQLANSTINKIENILHRKSPFQSEKIREDSDSYKKQCNDVRNVWITGKEGLTEREAAEMLITEARKYVKYEMGLVEAKWESSTQLESDNIIKFENNYPINFSFSENETKNSLKNDLKSVKDSPALCPLNKNRIPINTASSMKPMDTYTSKTPQKKSSFNEGLNLIPISKNIQTEKNNQCQTSTRRSIDLLENYSSFCNESINKKKKISNFEIATNINPEEEMNCSYYANKLREDSAKTNLNEFIIIDVCSDNSIFELFKIEIGQKKTFALSLACYKHEASYPIIGPNQKVGITDKTDSFIFQSNRCLDGFAIYWGGNIVFYLSLQKTEYHTAIRNLIKKMLSSTKLKIQIFDSKEQIKFLHYHYNMEFHAEVDDPKVADWILNPDETEKTLQAMCAKYCSETMKLVQLIGGCKDVGSIGLDCYSTVDPKIRSSVECLITWNLMKSLKIKLNEIGDKYLTACDIETEIRKCLARIELNGMSVEKELLQKLVEILKNLTKAIEKKAFSLAGRQFNIESSIDVAKVLGIFRGRMTSTRKQIIESMDHPIANLIVQWRKINSTLIKMIYPLINTIKGNRIHGCYLCHTSTGRILMHEPNLQNLVKDFEIVNPLTKEQFKISCRGVFVVPADHILLSADYCQLELRILAHFSKDKLLCEIMSKPGDVFKTIAAKWNNIEEDKVLDSLRQQTKGLCYGIIYGMGTKSLSDQLKITETEAVVLMDSFRNTYPGIKSFIAKTLSSCHVKGYVETLKGRRRYLRNINSSDISKRGQAERQAVNSVIQGSAADIAKVAMINMERELQELFHKIKYKPKLVLHLHDELIYEVPLQDLKKVAYVLKKNMENSVKLSVPFPVKLKSGSSWGDMSEYYV